MATQITRMGLAAGPNMIDMRNLNPVKKNRANNTVSPRTRDGAKYPGGRAMRRAMARLSARKATTPNKGGYNTPGSMVR